VLSSTVKYWGFEPLTPGQMSATSAVPAAVPSERHSSKPWTPSSALKNNVSPSTARLVGLLLAEPGLRSATISVRADVPSERHSSRPWTPSSAVK
jgi:hypothetical protein